MAPVRVTVTVIFSLSLRLGLVRLATSLLVALLAYVLNRVLIVEYQVPAATVTFVFACQHLVTPLGLVAGYLSDRQASKGWRRTPFIWLGLGLCLLIFPLFPWWGERLAAAPADPVLFYFGVGLFLVFGAGTTISATAVNALLVDLIPEGQRGAALTLVWFLTLSGFIIGLSLFNQIFVWFKIQHLGWLFFLFALLAALVAYGSLRQVEGAAKPLRGSVSQGPALKQGWRQLSRASQGWLFFCFLAAAVFFLALQNFLLAPYGGAVLLLPVAATAKFGLYISYGTLAGMALALVLARSSRSGAPKPLLAAALGLGALAYNFFGLSGLTSLKGLGIVGLWLFGLAKGLFNTGISHLTMRLAHPAFGGVFMGCWNLVSGLALAAGEMAGGFFLVEAANYLGAVPLAYSVIFWLAAAGLLASLILLYFIDIRRYWQQVAPDQQLQQFQEEPKCNGRR